MSSDRFYRTKQDDDILTARAAVVEAAKALCLQGMGTIPATTLMVAVAGDEARMLIASVARLNELERK